MEIGQSCTASYLPAPIPPGMMYKFSLIAEQIRTKTLVLLIPHYTCTTQDTMKP